MDSNSFVVPRGILQLSLFEEAVLWRTLELEVRNLVLVSLLRVVCLIMGSFKSADQLVHGIETGVSRQSSDPDSRFNGSSWISFSSLHSCQTDSKPDVPVDQSSDFSRDEQPVQLGSGEPVVHASGDHEVLRSESEERVVHTSEEHEACERLPMVVPSRAWVDEVKTFKKGDVFIGRGSKQRGLLPSFWANRYKVSKFGRDRAVELHATEVQEDPQYRLRIHELSGKRLLCHCRPAEKVSRRQPPSTLPRSAPASLRSKQLVKTATVQRTEHPCESPRRP